jgi:predicted MPP superfamily phosphohydrolase
MKNFKNIANEINSLTNYWATKLLSLSDEVISSRRNSQNRSIKQIVGHLVDSASNNTHRAVHLQYQKSPLEFPNYATHGNNDRWISIQNYQDENWENLVQLWKFSMLHFAHVIKHINPEKLKNTWLGGDDEEVTLEEMVEYFLPHFELHLKEIEELMALE